MLGGVTVTVHLFLMRASFSGAAFCQASLVETQQAFLELHVEAFEWFGGVFAQVRYDNLTSAVKQVLRGRRRVETDRFVALRSHYLFESQFTTPGIEGAHEKGGVEGEVGRFRRNHLVPVPAVATLAELNALLLAGCERDLGRRIVGRSVTVGEAWATERPLLRALPAERVRRGRDGDAAGRREVAGDGPPEPLLGPGRAWPGCGSAPGSAPARSRSATAAGRSPATSGSRAGSAPAPSSTTTSSCSQRKPGGLEHSLALRQERERGAWPDCFDELWAALTVRYGRSEAARQMVDVLLLSREHGPARVELAVRGALAAGAHDGRAVAVLARRARPAAGPRRRRSTDLDAAARRRMQRPAPDLDRVRPAARRSPMTARNAKTAALEALIEAHAVELKLPTVRRRFRALAAEATREQQTPVAYLGALLEAEMTERAERRETPPTDRRPLPADQTPRGLPVRRQPEGPAGHDRRARRGHPGSMTASR